MTQSKHINPISNKLKLNKLDLFYNNMVRTLKGHRDSLIQLRHHLTVREHLKISLEQ
jgi:hypothetical protein